MKLKIIITMMLLATLGFASEQQGYKIVLKTFSTLDDARAAMDKMVVSDRNQELKSKYGFNIVSRSSGKSYILAAEPFQNGEGAQEVMKSFKEVYKDAYVSGYYGPTQGSVFMTTSLDKQTTPASAEKIDESKPAKKESPSVTPSPKSDGFPWLWVALIGFPAAGAITGLFFGRSKQTNS